MMLPPPSALHAGRVWTSTLTALDVGSPCSRATYLYRAGREALFHEIVGGQVFYSGGACEVSTPDGRYNYPTHRFRLLPMADVEELPNGGHAIAYSGPRPYNAFGFDAAKACLRRQSEPERQYLKERRERFRWRGFWFWIGDERPAVTLNKCKQAPPSPPPLPRQDSTLLTVPRLTRGYGRMCEEDELKFFGNGSAL
ncbi:hypothetical protein BV25DRAFT_1993129 [Artomyces pyxidatus]|uniref:Uncharacterized protein n=1 Tax=Artomyces pyxidatus TaxID=48021 RepID=A0ACB8SUC1_9AGAM|nr:hypothetical protein BV25DRAFT_1993129 [Artomyces pyxidatus]